MGNGLVVAETDRKRGLNMCMQRETKYILDGRTIYFIMPKPTNHELRMRDLLKKRHIPFEVDRNLFYSLGGHYTPDLIVGGNLIVEIDGKVHDSSWKITPDRIRQRALEMMGYTVMRLKNEEIDNDPERCADIVQEEFYKVTGISKQSKVIRIPSGIYTSNETLGKKSNHHKLLKENISLLQFDSSKFKESLEAIISGASNKPNIVEIALLLLYGYSLVSEEDGKELNFQYAAESFGKCLSIAETLFGQYGKIGLRNSFFITAPNFIKNLVLNGGPDIRPKIVEITNEEGLNSTINKFNQFFREFDIVVEKSDVMKECCAALKREHSPRLAWLESLCGLS